MNDTGITNDAGHTNEEPAALPLLDRLREHGVLSPLDYHFARHLLDMAGEASEDVALCAALASRAVQQGHVCLNLRSLERSPPLGRDDEPLVDVAWPPAERLVAALRQSALVRADDPLAPLCLEGGERLYLRRYAAYERALADDLSARAASLEIDVDHDALAEGLARLFPRVPGDGDRARRGERQRLAACIAVLRRLTVICGGPGTGKTTTVVKTLCLLQEQRRRRGQRPLDVLLLAPTGKAAQRLAEAVQAGLEALPIEPEIKASIPPRAATIHRALGLRNQPSARPRHDKNSPLAADVVLVDEVSMVDIGLLYRLTSAVRPDARLILQGDPDQLVSVEAGAILGDIYPRDRADGYSSAFAALLTRLTGSEVLGALPRAGLHDCLVTLNESYRYPEHSPLGQLARAINRGDAPAALGLLTAPATGDPSAVGCRLIEPGSSGARQRSELAESVVRGYEAFVRAREPADKLARLSDYRVLCSHRRGPYGVEQLNRDIEGWLEEAGLLRLGADFYEHRPIIVTQNDYQLDLMNGDVGVVVRTAEQALRVCFPSQSGLRFLLPSRLPPHETVFATTVHKSQGSEFDEVAIVLPATPSKLLVRELLYTAVTRAKRKVEIFGRRDLVTSAVHSSIERASGLRERLWA